MSNSPQTSKRKLLVRMGDMVEFDTQNLDVLTFKLRANPMDVMKFLEDRTNPRFTYLDTSELEIPEDTELRWMVTEQRDLFTPKGYRVRLVKICNLKTNTSGWIPGASLKVILASPV